MNIWGKGGFAPRERSDHIEWPLQEYTINIFIKCSPNNENNSVKRKRKR